jgi:hypothetical protein
MAITPATPVKSPSLNELGPAMLTDENGNHIPTLGVVLPSSAGHSGLASGLLKDGQVSQVTARQDPPQAAGSSVPAVPVIALVGINATTGALQPFAAPSVSGKFQSTVQTATGSAQNIAHGLGVVPSLVLVSVYSDTALSTWSVVEGTHTTTNCVVTGTSGLTYKVIAFV